MAHYQRSQRLGIPLDTVWKTVGDVTRWPQLFSALVRIDPAAAEGGSERVVATDRHSRQFGLSVSKQSSATEHRLDVTVAPSAGQPRAYRRLAWTVRSDQNQTVLTLDADYHKPVPLIGAWLSRLRGLGDAEAGLDSAFDNAVRLSNETVWNYQETVQTILSRKGVEIVSARPNDSVGDISRLIHTHRIGAVLILGDGGELVGLVSERDIVYNLAQSGAATLELSAADIMTRDLIVCEPQSDLLFVMACMSDNKIRHLPVLKDGELAGVISIGDVVRQRMHTLEAESDTLRDYIASREWRFHSPHGIPAGERPAAMADEG